MLRELYIKNYALIDEIVMKFSNELTVLSGETGAGKSIIVGALNLILGEKAKTSTIRSGSDQCTVEGRFHVDADHPVQEILERKGIGNSGHIVIRRVITRSGNSKCFVNGLQVAVKDLQEITNILIDIHGQHEHQSLLNVHNHLFLLDHYGKLQKDLSLFQRSYRIMLDIQDRIERLRIDDREKERKIDILKYSIKEIESAEITEGEDEELEKEYRILKNYEELVSAAGATHNFLKANESSALPLLDEAIAELSKIREYSSDIGVILDNLETAKISIEECAYSLQSYIEGIAYEPGKIDRILSRIELIKGLKKKYGETVQEIKEYGEKCAQELLSLESNEKTIRELNSQLIEEKNRAHKYAIALSAQRRVAAKTLEESIMKELSYLSMGKARFSVNLTYRETDTGTVNIDGKSYELFAHGLDRVEFMITTNVGEPLMPLKNVASGGELSRIMLAIKTVLGNVDPIRTFVFDEVDAGIGGKVSWAVGNRLKELSELKQILCVTHQAQIASRGDLNVRVDKINRDGRTFTAVKVLDGREKVEEIARMISGKTISDTALKQAYEMIRET